MKVLASWDWETRPTAVLALDSDSHPLLICSLARELARLGRLTDLGTLQYAPERRPVTAANSAYRVAALHGSWLPPDPAAIVGAAGGPVLLVDDVTDTGWTLTMAARVVRAAGRRRCCRSRWPAPANQSSGFTPPSWAVTASAVATSARARSADLVVRQRLSDLHRRHHGLALVVVVDRRGDHADVVAGLRAARVLAAQIDPLADVGHQFAKQRPQFVGQVARHPCHQRVQPSPAGGQAFDEIAVGAALRDHAVEPLGVGAQRDRRLLGQPVAHRLVVPQHEHQPDRRGERVTLADLDAGAARPRAPPVPAA